LLKIYSIGCSRAGVWSGATCCRYR
jgi:hypothetical protein